MLPSIRNGVWNVTAAAVTKFCHQYRLLLKILPFVQTAVETNKKFCGVAHCARLRDRADQRRIATGTTNWDDVRLPQLPCYIFGKYSKI